MGIMVYSVSCVIQDFDHQPYGRFWCTGAFGTRPASTKSLFRVPRPFEAGFRV